jgi:hypothetical protein
LRDAEWILVLNRKMQGLTGACWMMDERDFRLAFVFLLH